MKYQVEYTGSAVRQLKKMDRKIAALIVAFIEERLVDCDNPRLYGKALKDAFIEIWRYRVGDYRILARIEDDQVNIVVVETGHRRDVSE